MRVCLIVFLLFYSSACAQQNPGIKIYNKVANAVVRITAYDENNTMIGQGSGVILKSKGWLITNYHLTKDAHILVALREGREIKLDSFVRKDPYRDILIISIDKKADPAFLKNIPDLKTVEYDALKIGQQVYAIGTPFGFENTITDGLISGLRNTEDSTKRYIQISAPFSPGSSGGAVVDSKGRLLGITTFNVSAHQAQNINFAICMDDILNWNKRETIDADRWMTDMENVYHHLKNKDYRGALKHSLQIHHAYASGFYLSNYYLGYLYEKTFRSDSALYFYHRCTELNPSFGEGYLGLSRIYMLKSDYEKAFDNQQKAYQLNPSLRNRRPVR